LVAVVLDEFSEVVAVVVDEITAMVVVLEEAF
jgi:hypothetical protein